MRITVNGREYNGIEEMPPDVRAQYERAMSLLADKNKNGVPDILEGANVRPAPGADAGKPLLSSIVTTQKIVINGQPYDRWEDLPADAREMMSRVGVGVGLGVGRAGFKSSSTGGLTFSADLRSGSASPDTGGDGSFTLHLTWSTVLAFLAALAVTAVVAWLLMSNRAK
jgi:hypothetical protein